MFIWPMYIRFVYFYTCRYAKMRCELSHLLLAARPWGASSESGVLWNTVRVSVLSEEELAFTYLRAVWVRCSASPFDSCV